MPLSYNNIIDIDRLLQTVIHVDEVVAGNGNAPAIAVGVKHGNPCGASAGEDPAATAGKMMAGDPLAIFGGLVMSEFYRRRDHRRIVCGQILDGIIAPSFTESAVSLRRKG
ncbi:MAG: hypothetical protein U0487_01640 [Patescibacteria group bacterium]